MGATHFGRTYTVRNSNVHDLDSAGGFLGSGIGANMTAVSGYATAILQAQVDGIPIMTYSPTFTASNVTFLIRFLVANSDQGGTYTYTARASSGSSSNVTFVSDAKYQLNHSGNSDKRTLSVMGVADFVANQSIELVFASEHASPSNFTLTDHKIFIF